jgi:hypothetical protein
MQIRAVRAGSWAALDLASPWTYVLAEELRLAFLALAVLAVVVYWLLPLRDQFDLQV